MGIWEEEGMAVEVESMSRQVLGSPVTTVGAFVQEY